MFYAKPPETSGQALKGLKKMGNVRKDKTGFFQKNEKNLKTETAKFALNSNGSRKVPFRGFRGVFRVGKVEWGKYPLRYE
jgi:hypothetical protein